MYKPDPADRYPKRGSSPGESRLMPWESPVYVENSPYHNGKASSEALSYSMSPVPELPPKHFLMRTSPLKQAAVGLDPMILSRPRTQHRSQRGRSPDLAVHRVSHQLSAHSNCKTLLGPVHATALLSRAGGFDESGSFAETTVRSHAHAHALATAATPYAPGVTLLKRAKKAAESADRAALMEAAAGEWEQRYWLNKVLHQRAAVRTVRSTAGTLVAAMTSNALGLVPPGTAGSGARPGTSSRSGVLPSRRVRNPHAAPVPSLSASVEGDGDAAAAAAYDAPGGYLNSGSGVPQTSPIAASAYASFNSYHSNSYNNVNGYLNSSGGNSMNNSVTGFNNSYSVYSAGGGGGGGGPAWVSSRTGALIQSRYVPSSDKRIAAADTVTAKAPNARPYTAGISATANAVAVPVTDASPAPAPAPAPVTVAAPASDAPTWTTSGRAHYGAGVGDTMRLPWSELGSRGDGANSASGSAAGSAGGGGRESHGPSPSAASTPSIIPGAASVTRVMSLAEISSRPPSSFALLQESAMAAPVALPLPSPGFPAPSPSATSTAAASTAAFPAADEVEQEIAAATGSTGSFPAAAAAAARPASRSPLSSSPSAPPLQSRPSFRAHTRAPPPANDPHRHRLHALSTGATPVRMEPRNRSPLGSALFPFENAEEAPQPPSQPMQPSGAAATALFARPAALRPVTVAGLRNYTAGGPAASAFHGYQG